MRQVSDCFKLELSLIERLAPCGDDSEDSPLLRLRPIKRARAGFRDESPCPGKPEARCTSPLPMRHQSGWMDPTKPQLPRECAMSVLGDQAGAKRRPLRRLTAEPSRMPSITSFCSVVSRRRPWSSLRLERMTTRTWCCTPVALPALESRPFSISPSNVTNRGAGWGVRPRLAADDFGGIS